MAPTLASVLLRGGPRGPGPVLLAVADRPGTAVELAERTGIRRPIVEAHLATLAGRSLVVRRERSYCVTPAGASVAERLDRVLTVVVAGSFGGWDSEKGW